MIEPRAPRDRNALTPFQEDILAAIRCFMDEHGWAPTMSELRTMLGERPFARVGAGVMALHRKGFIVNGPQPRCIALTPKADSHRNDLLIEDMRQTLNDESRERLIELAEVLIKENRTLRFELKSKSTAVQVQQGMRRWESIRRQDLERQIREKGQL